jgi:hypothetical protein
VKALVNGAADPAADGPRGRARRRGARVALPVFLPARSLPARREAIASEGAEVVVVDGAYKGEARGGGFDADHLAPGVHPVPRGGRGQRANPDGDEDEVVACLDGRLGEERRVAVDHPLPWSRRADVRDQEWHPARRRRSRLRRRRPRRSLPVG